MLDVSRRMDKVPEMCMYELGQPFPLELANRVELDPSSNLNMLLEPDFDHDLLYVLNCPM